MGLRPACLFPSQGKTDTLHWLPAQPENRDGSIVVQQKDSGSFYTFSNPSIEINAEATWLPVAGQKARTSQTSSATAGSSNKPPQNQVVYKYDCPYCDMRFSRTNNLRGHLVKHTGIKEFICSLCGKEYAYKQCLKEHLHIYHDVVMT